jgi:sporulation protein YqfC
VERFFVNQINNNQIVVGGVRKLAEFDGSRVVVLVAGAQIVISGDNLKIARFDENEICIEGKIAGVETDAQRKKVL